MYPEVNFIFQGTRYAVSSGDLKNKSRIALPDGRILEFHVWFTFDEKPDELIGLHEVSFLKTGDLSLELVAQEENAALAWVIPPSLG